MAVLLYVFASLASQTHTPGADSFVEYMCPVRYTESDLRMHSFICSYMRIFSIKARDRNLGSGMARYEANAVYQRDY